MPISNHADSIQQQKKIIRQQFRQIRNKITGKQAEQAGLALAEQFKNIPEFQSAKNIACFISFDGEINTKPLIEMIIKDKDVCYLPKLKPNKPNRLWFLPYAKGVQLVNNRLGIPEVDLPVNHALAVSKLDLILIPLVAFDNQGNRLGMGGGFYDTSLAHLSNRTGSRPQCIGVAYQQQMVDAIPLEAWDFALDGVLTQQQSYRFSN